VGFNFSGSPSLLDAITLDQDFRWFYVVPSFDVQEAASLYQDIGGRLCISLRLRIDGTTDQQRFECEQEDFA
jgi:hypothetical protein